MNNYNNKDVFKVYDYIKSKHNFIKEFVSFNGPRIDDVFPQVMFPHQNYSVLATFPLFSSTVIQKIVIVDLIPDWIEIDAHGQVCVYCAYNDIYVAVSIDEFDEENLDFIIHYLTRYARNVKPSEIEI